MCFKISKSYSHEKDGGVAGVGDRKGDEKVRRDRYWWSPSTYPKMLHLAKTLISDAYPKMTYSTT